MQLRPISIADRSRGAWLLGLGTTLAFIPLTVALQRFARDDWSIYVAMRQLHADQSLISALVRLASNEWFGGHELRIFFGSFLVHFVLANSETFGPVLAYLWLASLHALSGILIGLLLWRWLRIQTVAIAAMIVATYFPLSAQAAIWANNLFFVQPWFFFLASLAIIFAPRFRPHPRVVLVTILSLCCAFSGEATLPLLLLTLAAWPIASRIQRCTVKTLLMRSIPLVVTLLALSAYLVWIRPSSGGTEIEFKRLEHFTGYLEQSRIQALGLLQPNSSYYGSGSVEWPQGAVWIATCLAAVGAIAVCVSLSRVPQNGPSRHLIVLGGLTLAIGASIAPWLLGVLTGARPGPDLRYLYVPAIIVATWVLVLVSMLFLIRRSIWAWLARALLAATVAFSTTMFAFNVGVVWAAQRAVDDRIWRELDKLVGPTTQVIVTYHPDHPYLMAPYHSAAFSDFQADWGVSGRISWLQPEWERIKLFRDAHIRGSSIALHQYYADAWTCMDYSQASHGRIVFMALNYGPELGDLGSSPLLVTEDFGEFERFKSENWPAPVRDAILEDEPECQ